MTTELKCSRSGCEERASWFVYWRNPKVHVANRRKTWLACESHREFFIEYLTVREFFLEAEHIE